MNLVGPPDLAALEEFQTAMADLYRGVRALANTGLVPIEQLGQFVAMLDRVVLGVGMDPADFSDAALRVGRRRL